MEEKSFEQEYAAILEAVMTPEERARRDAALAKAEAKRARKRAKRSAFVQRRDAR